MLSNNHQKLFEKNLIDQKQFDYLEAIASKKIISVAYELRTLLYLGVLLFTTGIGILIYQNIGQVGHIVAIALLFLITIGCFWYVFKHSAAYSHQKIKEPTPYFDYLLLLGSLLTLSIQGYFQFLFDYFNDYLSYSALITATLFFFLAYRFDHLGILSLGITALVSYFGISISPQKWYSDAFFSSFHHLYNTGIICSTIIASVAIYLDKKDIKKHFTFTYINFCSLIFFTSVLVGIFDSEITFLYVVLLFSGCALTVYYANWKKSFLFLLYAFLTGYIGTTYLLSLIMDTSDHITLWLYYSLFSCAGLIYFIVKYKNHFKK